MNARDPRGRRLLAPVLLALAAGATALPALAQAAKGAAGAPPASGFAFVDATASSGLDVTLTSGTTPSRYILDVNGGGVALFDYDRDDDLDLFLANGATVADTEKGPGSRLYANRGDGTFEDATERVGLKLTRWAMGVAVGDHDGDGDDDLYVTCFGPNVLLRNDCDAEGCRFTDVTEQAGVGDPRWATSAAFGDLDLDGDLDLYAVNYLEFDPADPPPDEGRRFLGVAVMAGPAGLPAQHDVLYENLGNGKFRDVTAASGARPERAGYGLGTVIFDTDRDGKPDVFVGNDSTPNFLFHNQGGMRFKEIGTLSGVASNYDGSDQATMGIALGDVDGNGYADLFTTNFSSDTNTLHLNLNGRFFDDRTSQYGLAMISRPFLSWGTGFFDFDLDGDEDLFIASGHVYPQAGENRMDSSYEQKPLLFDRQGKRFEVVEDAGPMFRERYPGRAAAFGDVDGDGDPDIVMTTLNDKVRLFRNDAARANAIVVTLETARGSRHVPASVVELTAAERVQRRWLGGGSYQSSNAPEAYFGLGHNEAGKVRVRVTWPDGKTTEHRGGRANRKLVIRADTPKVTPRELHR